MRVEALSADHTAAALLAGTATGEKALFSSGTRELHAEGILAAVRVPAKGGQRPDSPFQRALQDAFQVAREAGQANPIVIGAIPFDVTEPSCLHVPQSYRWQERSAARDTDRDEAFPALLDQQSIPDEAAFKRAVEHAIANFSFSDVSKAVLSVMRELHFSAPIDVERLLDALRAQNEGGYQFRLPLPDGSELVGVSPELLLRKQGDRILSNPLAGSARRHTDPDADQVAAKRLAASAKDRYEHRIVIDDVREILTRHCAELDCPEAPSVISTPTLWHLSTTLEGRLHDPSVSALQLACELHPTPAVCGFPTERAHKLIRFVEPFERGLFTGIVGWSDAEGNGEWVVTIRCGIVKQDVIRLFAGAGIVAASQPEAEWAETQTKLRTMLHACGLAA